MQSEIANLIKEANGSSKGLKEKKYTVHYGVNRLADKLSQPDEYFYTLRNCYVSKQNLILQRNGFTKISTTALTGTPKIRKMFEYENETGGRTTIVRGGTRWARYNAGTKDFTDLDASRASDAYGQMTQFTYYGIMTDGGRARKFTSGWTVSDVDTTYAPTHSSCCHTHNHRLVLNDDDNMLTFYLSKVDAIDFDTTGSDAAIINLSNVVPVGDRIIGFSSYLSNYLIIWLRKTIVVYDVPTTTANIKLQQVIRTGCLSYEGIIHTASGDIYYPNETGYKSFIQSFVTQSILDIKDETSLIGPYYREQIQDVSEYRDIIGINYKALDHSIFKLPATNQTELWIISEDLKVATGGKGNIAGYYTGINPYSFLVDGEDKLLFGGGDGHIYRMDYGTSDNGTAIQIEIGKTGMYFDNQSIYKKPKEFEAVVESSKSFTLNLTYDYGVFGSSSSAEQISISVTSGALWDIDLWDVALWGASGQTLVRSRNLQGRGKFMNMKLTHSTKDAIIKIPYFIIRYFPMGVD